MGIHVEQHDREYMKEATKDRDNMIGGYWQKQITTSKIAQVKNFNKSFQVQIQMSILKGFDAGKGNERRKKDDFYLLGITTR